MRSVSSPADRTALSDRLDALSEAVSGRVGAILAVPSESVDSTPDLDVVYERNADEPFTAASTIKLPLCYAFYAAAEAGDLPDRSTPWPLADDNRVGGSGLLSLLDGEPTLGDLPRATIAISDNAATNELIDLLGMDAANEAARSLGMEQTHLGRRMMATLEGEDDPPDPDYDPEGDEGPINTISPRDCLRFFLDFYREATLSGESYADLREALHWSTSTFGRYLPYGTTIANKTGWVPTASLDVGLVFPEGDGLPLLFAVMADELDHGAEGSDAIAAMGEVAYGWLTR